MTTAAHYFQTIGTTMQDRLGRNRVKVEAIFPELATAVLGEIPMPVVNVLAMTDWAASQHPLPKQVNFHGSFGDPPLVVFETPEFYLEVLFWFPSRTAIHGHGFTGAFKVLDGYSIQVEYEFSEEAAPEEGVRLGRTVPRAVKMIAPGQVCTIGGNDAFIHSVAHMGNPSLTLVARTHGSQEFEQFSYHRCGLATRASWHHRSIARQAEVFRALHRGHPDAFRPRLMEFLERSGAFVFFHLLDELRTRMPMHVFTREVLSPARERFHPGHAMELAALDEEVRREALWAMLNATPDPRRRLLMALNEILPDDAEREKVISSSNGGIAAAAVIEQWSRHAQS